MVNKTTKAAVAALMMGYVAFTNSDLQYGNSSGQGFPDKTRNNANTVEASTSSGNSIDDIANGSSSKYNVANNSQQHEDLLSYEERLNLWLNQPIEKTLDGIDGITYVNDKNFDEEVYGSDKKTIVLFYGTDDPSRGLAAALRSIDKEFNDSFRNEFKICAYDDGTGDFMSKDEFLELEEMYGIKSAPALVFYGKEGGKMQKMDELWNLYGGIIDLDYLEEVVDAYKLLIPRRMLD